MKFFCQFTLTKLIFASLLEISTVCRLPLPANFRVNRRQKKRSVPFIFGRKYRSSFESKGIWFLFFVFFFLLNYHHRFEPLNCRGLPYWERIIFFKRAGSRTNWNSCDRFRFDVSHRWLSVSRPGYVKAGRTSSRRDSARGGAGFRSDRIFSLCNLKNKRKHRNFRHILASFGDMTPCGPTREWNT